ncbi:sugar phosphate isomerase/epimerase [Pseudomonadales bacterium]|nr:sugar phosphate isomerase/epimerase [Pseudomonadales bacterium]
MNYVAKFGVSQGRLVLPENGELQCFPQSNWQKEFEIAGRVGLDFIELLVERQPNKSNPFWSQDGRKSIRQAGLENGVEIYSCCFDYVIDHDLANQNKTYKVELIDFFKACEDLSIPLIVLPLLERSDLTKETYKQYVPLIQEIADRFLSKATNLCIESLLPAPDLLAFLELVDRKNVSCVYDSGNRIALGADLESEILLLNDWIKHFHIKDKNALGENVILGTGLVDFRSVFGALRDIDYRGRFNFETTRGQIAEKTMAYHYYLSKFFFEESYLED